MRNLGARSILCSRPSSFPMTLAVLGLLAACVSAPDHPDWIHVGVTTKDEVIIRYGQPDVVIASPGGDTAVYRPSASVPRLEIPTAQAGPFGTVMTSMQPIDQGLGAKDLNSETKDLSQGGIRIRYDARGVVQDLSSP